MDTWAFTALKNKTGYPDTFPHSTSLASNLHFPWWHHEWVSDPHDLHASLVQAVSFAYRVLFISSEHSLLFRRIVCNTNVVELANIRCPSLKTNAFSRSPSRLIGASAWATSMNGPRAESNNVGRHIEWDDLMIDTAISPLHVRTPTPMDDNITLSSQDSTPLSVLASDSVNVGLICHFRKKKWAYLWIALAVFDVNRIRTIVQGDASISDLMKSKTPCCAPYLISCTRHGSHCFYIRFHPCNNNWN